MRLLSSQWTRRLSSRLSILGGLRVVKRSTTCTGERSEAELGRFDGTRDTEQTVSRGPPSLQLPLELWAEVLSYLEAKDLAKMARLCRPLQEEAGKHLYRSVTLARYAIVLFHRTITASPRHASLVRCVDVFLYDDFDTLIPACLAEVLGARLPLRYLSIRGSRHAMWNQEVIRYCKTIFERHFPDLRGFRTNLPQMLFPGIIEFVQAHPELEELHMEMEDLQLPISLAVSPSVRTLACYPRFVKGQLLHGRLRGLTHLHLGRFSYGDMKVLSETLGPQLVSLRLGTQVNASPNRPWTIEDIATKFPGLRFIHVDMGVHSHGPRMHARPIDWQAKARETQSTPPPSGALTIVWAYPHREGVVLSEAAAWHTFLNKTAYEVLTRWTPYVARIVFRHTIIPYVSATLSQDQTRLVKEKNVAMSDDYWKSV